jgi:hypothetical protein
MGGWRGFIAILAGIAGLLVVTVVVVLLAGDRPPRTYPAGSPEAAYQAYVTAWQAGDDEAAYASFTTAVRAETPYADYHRQAIEYRLYGQQPGTTTRVFIDAATVQGETATLQVTVETSVVSGLGANRYRSTLPVTLVREDGAWRLDTIRMGTEPWWPNKP